MFFPFSENKLFVSFGQADPATLFAIWFPCKPPYFILTLTLFPLYLIYCHTSYNFWWEALLFRYSRVSSINSQSPFYPFPLSSTPYLLFLFLWTSTVLSLQPFTDTLQSLWPVAGFVPFSHQPPISPKIICHDRCPLKNNHQDEKDLGFVPSKEVWNCQLWRDGVKRCVAAASDYLPLTLTLTHPLTETNSTQLTTCSRW